MRNKKHMEKKFRISGYMDGMPCQLDVDASNKSEAKEKAESEYNWDSIHNISEIKP